MAQFFFFFKFIKDAGSSLKYFFKMQTEKNLQKHIYVNSTISIQFYVLKFLISHESLLSEIFKFKKSLNHIYKNCTTFTWRKQ